MTLGIQQPPSGNFDLFLHVLGATATFGATLAVAILGFAALRAAPERAQWLRRLTFRVGLFALVPAFIVMRVGAQLIANDEYPGDAKTPGWLDVGFIVTEPGAILVLVVLILAYLAGRRAQTRLATVVPWLATVYVVALGVAWFAMSAKPGS
jgi:hypothetical protein